MYGRDDGATGGVRSCGLRVARRLGRGASVGAGEVRTVGRKLQPNESLANVPWSNRCRRRDAPADNYL